MEDFIKLFKSIKVVDPQNNILSEPVVTGLVYYLFQIFEENGNIVLQMPRQVGTSTILDAYIIYKSLNNVEVYNEGRFQMIQQKVGQVHGHKNCYMKGGRIRQPYGAEITTNIIGKDVGLVVIDNPRGWVSMESLVGLRKTIVVFSGNVSNNASLNNLKKYYKHIKIDLEEINEINKKFIRINKINTVLE